MTRPMVARAAITGRGTDSFHRKNVRVGVIGNLDMFPEDIQDMTSKWIEQTKNNKKNSEKEATFELRKNMYTKVYKHHSTPRNAT